MWKAVGWQCPISAVQWVLEEPSFAHLHFTVAQQRSEQGAVQGPRWQKHDTPLARAVRHAGLCWGQPAGCSGPALPRDTAHPGSLWSTDCAQPSTGHLGDWCVLPVNACWSCFLLVFWEMDVCLVACKVRRVGSSWLQLLGLGINFWRMLTGSVRCLTVVRSSQAANTCHSSSCDGLELTTIDPIRIHVTQSFLYLSCTLISLPGIWANVCWGLVFAPAWPWIEQVWV